MEANPPAHLIPVSSASRDRLADTLPNQPDLSPAWRHYIDTQWLRTRSRKHLHKRLLLLDAVENLPL